MDAIKRQATCGTTPGAELQLPVLCCQVQVSVNVGIDLPLQRIPAFYQRPDRSLQIPANEGIGCNGKAVMRPLARMSGWGAIPAPAAVPALPGQLRRPAARAWQPAAAVTPVCAQTSHQLSACRTCHRMSEAMSKWYHRRPGGNSDSLAPRDTRSPSAGLPDRWSRCLPR